MAPRIDSLSQHRLEVGQQDRIFVHGSGFVDLQGVAVGDQWAPDFRVDGETEITLTLPSLTAGTYWIVAWTNGGESSPMDGANQQLEIVDAAATHAALRLDSITPEEVVLPYDGQAMWLHGAGLTRVTAAMTGHHAITFEGYDETRLTIWLPEHLEAQAGHDIEIEVLAGAESAKLRVPVRGRPDAGGEATAPSVFGVEPASVPSSGGAITVSGWHFSAGTQIYVGDTACTDIDVVTEGSIRCTVPPIEGHDGESLMVIANANGWTSPNTDVHLLITG